VHFDGSEAGLVNLFRLLVEGRALELDRSYGKTRRSLETEREKEPPKSIPQKTHNSPTGWEPLPWIMGELKTDLNSLPQSSRPRTDERFINGSCKNRENFHRRHKIVFPSS
jgi:hypothetical protein